MSRRCCNACVHRFPRSRSAPGVLHLGTRWRSDGCLVSNGRLSSRCRSSRLCAFGECAQQAYQIGSVHRCVIVWVNGVLWCDFRVWGWWNPAAAGRGPRAAPCCGRSPRFRQLLPGRAIPDWMDRPYTMEMAVFAHSGPYLEPEYRPSHCKWCGKCEFRMFPHGTQAVRVAYPHCRTERAGRGSPGQPTSGTAAAAEQVRCTQRRYGCQWMRATHPSMEPCC